MRSAGVVADHSAQGAAVLGGGVGRKKQAELARFGVQDALHHSGLHHRGSPLGIDRGDLRHVAGEVQHQGGVAGVSAEAGAAAARHDGHLILARQRQGVDDILLMARTNDSDGHLAIIGSVGGIYRERAGIKADIAFKNSF